MELQSPGDVATRLGATGTSATSRWRRSRTSRWRCSGHCCSRGSPGPARPRSPRRSRRRSSCRWSGCSATRASTRRRRSTTGTSRARSCICARSRRRRGTDVEEAEKSLYDARFLLARPVLQALQQPGGAAGRRGGPGRRRVRGVPAGGALDVPGDDPGARHRPRRRAADRRPHLQPHPRAARRAQAALPLPLDRPPRPRARGEIVRSRAPECREKLAGQVVELVQQLRTGRPAQAAGRGRDPRLGARPQSPRHRRDRPRDGRRDAGRAGEVPRGQRPRKQALDRMLADHEPRADPPAVPTRSCSGFARALRAAGVPVTQDRTHGFLAAVATLGARRPAGDVPRRPGDAVRRARRHRAVRPGLRGLLQRARRAAPRPAGQPSTPASRSGCRRRGRRGRRRRRPTRWSGRWPVRPRCSGTATSRR